MGRKRREVLREPATAEEEATFKAVLADIRESVKIAKDVCVNKNKATKERFIQLFLAESNFILDTSMDLAKDDQITFSFQGMDVQYPDDEPNKPQLVHPDTDKVAELEARIDNREWDSSDCGPEY